MNRWYDATIEVRVYLDDAASLDDEDVEGAVTGALDDAHQAVEVVTLAGGKEYRRPLLDGMMLSVQFVDLGELRSVP